MRKFWIALLMMISWLAYADPQPTTITGPVFTTTGSRYTGSFTVQAQAKTNVGYAVTGAPVQTVYVVNGDIQNFQLLPNDTSTPNLSSYFVQFANGDKWICIVQTSSTPVTFPSQCSPNAVPPNTATPFSISQIIPSSTNGQIVQTINGIAQWGNVSGSMFGNQTANTLFAGPASGSTATPSFRALVVADLCGGGGASSSTFLRGDCTWAAPTAQVAVPLNRIPVGTGTGITSSSNFTFNGNATNDLFTLAGSINVTNISAQGFSLFGNTPTGGFANAVTLNQFVSTDAQTATTSVIGVVREYNATANLGSARQNSMTVQFKTLSSGNLESVGGAGTTNFIGLLQPQGSGVISMGTAIAAAVQSSGSGVSQGTMNAFGAQAPSVGAGVTWDSFSSFRAIGSSATTFAGTISGPRIAFREDPILSTVTKTVTGVAGQNTITVSPDNTSIVVGQRVMVVGIRPAALVTGISGNTITLSVNNLDTVSGTASFITDACAGLGSVTLGMCLNDPAVVGILQVNGTATVTGLITGSQFTVGAPATLRSAGYNSNRTYTDPSLPPLFGFYDTSSVAAVSTPYTGYLIGAVLQPEIPATNTQNWTSNVFGSLVGVLAVPTIEDGATGSINNIIGVEVSGTTIHQMNAVSYIGVQIHHPTVTTGSVTNAVGTEINYFNSATNNTQLLLGGFAQPAGNWNIYTSNDTTTYPNYLGAGRTLLGSTTDDGTNILQVNGSAKVTGTFTASSLGSGLAKFTSGVLGLATAGTDYAGPTNGTNGQALTSNGSGGFGTAISIGTSGAVIPLLNGNNTWSGTATFNGGTVDVSGATGLKVPTSAGLAPTGDSFLGLNSTNHTLVAGSNGTTLVLAAAATGTGTATTCSAGTVLTSISAIAAPGCNPPFTLTTTGTSGAATFSAGTLNIPQASANAPPSFPSGQQLTYLNFKQSDPSQGNLLVNSNTLNSSWTAQAITVTGGQADPLGGSTAWKLAEDATTNYHWLRQSVSNLTLNATYTFSGFVAPSTGRTWAQIVNTNSAVAVATINLSTCAAGNVAGGTLVVTASTLGYCQFAYTYTQNNNLTHFDVGLGPSPNITGGSYAGTSGDGILAWHFWFGPGAIPPSTWSDTPLASYTVTDLTGRGNNGTVVGGLQILPQGGIQFTGTSGQYVSVAGIAAAKTISVTVDLASPINGTLPVGPLIGNTTTGNFSAYYSKFLANSYNQMGRISVLNGASFVSTPTSSNTCTGPKVNLTFTQTADANEYAATYCNGFLMLPYLGGATFARNGTVTIGGDPFNSSYLVGKVWNVAAWDYALSQDQVYQWSNFAVSEALNKGVIDLENPVAGSLNQPTPAGIAWCVGDSITIGAGPVNSWCNSSNASLTPTLPYTYYLLGVAGETLYTGAARLVPGPNSLLPWLAETGRNDYAQQKVIAIYEGTNDIGVEGKSAASTAAYLWQAVTNAHQTIPGAKVCVGTLISRSNGSQDASLSSFNSLVRNNWKSSGADCVIDFGAIPQLSPNGSNYSNATYYQGDGVHPTQVGQNLMAALWTTVLNSLTANQGSATYGTPAPGVCHAQYLFSNDGGGSPGLITPITNCVIPANSIITSAVVDWTTAGVGSGNSTSVGLSGTGGGTAVLQASTAVASLTGITTSAVTTPFKLTTAGAVTLTTSGAALTAGTADVTVSYITAAN